MSQLASSYINMPVLERNYIVDVHVYTMPCNFQYRIITVFLARAACNIMQTCNDELPSSLNPFIFQSD